MAFPVKRIGGLLGVLALLVLPGFIYADGGDATLIHACVGTDGTTRIVSPEIACKKNEIPLHWPTLARIQAAELALQSQIDSQNSAIAALQTHDTTQDEQIERARTRVAARYVALAPQSFPRLAETVVNFETMQVDTAAAVTTGAGWHFTAPETGLYHVRASLIYDFSTDWTPIDGAHNVGNLFLRGSGGISGYLSVLARTTQFDSTNSALYMQGEDVVHLAAGDTIYITQFHGAAAALNLFPASGGLTNFSFISVTLLQAD